MKGILNFAILLACLLYAGSSYSAEAPTLKEVAEQKDKKEKLEEIAAEQAAGPYDEFNRTTPRSSLAGLALAVKGQDFERAVNYLDLRNLPFSLDEDLDGEDLVRKLVIVAKRAMTVDIDDLSEEPSGHLDDGLPSYRDRITTIKTQKGPVDILMQRVPRKDGVQIWKISNKTVAQIPALDKEFGYGVIGAKMSLVFPHYIIFGLELWQLTLLAILIAIGYMIAIVVTHIIIKMMLIGQRFKTERLKQSIVGPLRFLFTVLFYRATFDLIAPTLAARALFDANTFLIAAILWITLGLVDLIMARMADRMEQNGQNDAVVKSPRRPKDVRGLRDSLRRPATNGHLLQLGGGQESDPLAVRGKERFEGSLGSL